MLRINLRTGRIHRIRVHFVFARRCCLADVNELYLSCAIGWYLQQELMRFQKHCREASRYYASSACLTSQDYAVAWFMPGPSQRVAFLRPPGHAVPPRCICGIQFWYLMLIFGAFHETGRLLLCWHRGIVITPQPTVLFRIWKPAYA